jgi:16S rRNA (adenine1518-N6/adenine1519-N6)-dimethyltransferase
MTERRTLDLASIMLFKVPTSKELFVKHQIKTQKKYGQNFIFDSNVTNKIAKSTNLDLSSFEVLEIGPGASTLTQSILRLNPKKLTVIETDNNLIPLLEDLKKYFPQQLEIIHRDALKINESEIMQQKPYVIISNLPYNIGTELIFKWILQSHCHIKCIVVLLQKEVVERILAIKDSKKYGRLSIIINLLCDTKFLFDVNPQSFTPAPKVMSSVIRISPKENLDISKEEISRIEKVAKHAFGMRRKKIKTSLKSIFPNSEEVLKNLNIDSNLRAENLTIEQFRRIAGECQ